MSETTLSVLALIFGGSGLLGFIGSIIVLVVNRRESLARIENLDSLTKKTKSDTQKTYQDQVTQVMDKNIALFNELQEEREENENKQKEYEAALKRINTDLENFKESLKNKESNEAVLLSDLERYKQMKQNDDVRMGELEQKLSTVENRQAEHGKELEKIKTGNLPAREDLRQK